MTNENEDIAERLVEAEGRGELIAAILDRELRSERVELARTLSDLHNACRIDLTSDSNLAAIHSLKKNEFWIVVHPLNNALSTLTCSHQDVLRFVNTLVETAGNDGAAGQPNLELVAWSKNNPDKARSIVEGIKLQEPLCLAHGLFAVIGLDDEAKGFDLVTSKIARVSAIGLSSLSRMETLAMNSIKRAIDEACDVVANQIDEEARASAIEAAFRLWEKLGPAKPYRQNEFINAIGNNGNPREISILSAMLFLHNNGLPKESIELVLNWLAVAPSNGSATLQNLDHAIRQEDKRWKFEQVVAVFEHCVPTLETKPESREYSSFTRWVWSNPSHSSYLFARWFNGGQIALCSYLGELLQGLTDSPGVNIQRVHLPSSEADQIFMARKSIGFLWHHEVTTATILLSIVKNGKAGGREVAEALLFNPLLVSYGGKLRDYLETQRSSGSKRIDGCVKRLLDMHDEHIKGSETPKSLVELMPSFEQRRAVAIKDHERNREIEKQAHERSIFANLVTQQTLLYGRKSFSIIHGSDGEKHPNVSALSEFSYSAELPRLSVIDPVGFNELLSIFRAMQRRPE